MTAAVASGAGSVGTSRTSVPSESGTNPHRSKKPATSASHSTRNRSTGAPLTTASTSERPMPRSRSSSSTKRFVSASSRSPTRSMPMPPTSSPSSLQPTRSRGARQQQPIRLGLHERGESLHLGVVGTATEIDESHAVASINSSASGANDTRPRADGQGCLRNTRGTDDQPIRPPDTCCARRTSSTRAIATRWTCPALARAAHLSPAHFSREFRKAFGETPHQYLLTRRLERAAALLRNTDRTVSEICFMVGLQSVGSFTSSFGRAYGCSPSRLSAPRIHRQRDQVRIPTCMLLAYGRPSRAVLEKTAG